MRRYGGGGVSSSSPDDSDVMRTHQLLSPLHLLGSGPLTVFTVLLERLIANPKLLCSLAVSRWCCGVESETLDYRLDGVPHSDLFGRSGGLWWLGSDHSG